MKEDVVIKGATKRTGDFPGRFIYLEAKCVLRFRVNLADWGLFHFFQRKLYLLYGSSSSKEVQQQQALKHGFVPAPYWFYCS